MIWFVLTINTSQKRNESHFEATLFKHVYQTKSNDYTKQNNMPILCYGGAQLRSLILSINHCVFVWHSAGKLDFPPSLNGIAQQDYFITDSLPSNAGYFCLGMVLLSNKQTELGGHGVPGLNHMLSCWFILWKWDSPSAFSSLFGRTVL